MLTISTPDGETWHLTPEQRDALTDLLAMPPDHLRALRDLAEQQIALEAIPPAATRLPIFSRGGDPVMPIACRTRTSAIISGEDPPRCTWRRDAAAGGYGCRVCGRWLRPGSVRAVELDAMVGDEGGEHD